MRHEGDGDVELVEDSVSAPLHSFLVLCRRAVLSKDSPPKGGRLVQRGGGGDIEAVDETEVGAGEEEGSLVVEKVELRGETSVRKAEDVLLVPSFRSLQRRGGDGV